MPHIKSLPPALPPHRFVMSFQRPNLRLAAEKRVGGFGDALHDVLARKKASGPRAPFAPTLIYALTTNQVGAGAWGWPLGFETGHALAAQFGACMHYDMCCHQSRPFLTSMFEVSCMARHISAQHNANVVTCGPATGPQPSAQQSSLHNSPPCTRMAPLQILQSCRWCGVQITSRTWYDLHTAPNSQLGLQ